MRAFWTAVLLVVGTAALCAPASIPGAIDETSASTEWFGVGRFRERSAPASPGAPYFMDKERGWFWYEREAETQVTEDAPVEVHTQVKEIPPKPAGTSEAPATPLSTAWFRQNMERFRDKAIDDPTPDNVSAYMYLQRVMLDKAERFATASQSIVMNDPILDENTRRPIAKFGADVRDELVAKSREIWTRKLAGSAGLWFFYESTCVFCEKQVAVLKGLQNAYGFKVLPIAMDGLPLPGNPFPNFIPDRGQARKLGVDITPALYLVRPGSDGAVLQISQGLFSADQIIDRTLILAHEKGWIPESAFRSMRRSEPIMVDTTLGTKITPEVLATPALLSHAIRSRLKERLPIQPSVPGR